MVSDRNKYMRDYMKKTRAEKDIPVTRKSIDVELKEVISKINQLDKEIKELDKQIAQDDRDIIELDKQIKAIDKFLAKLNDKFDEFDESKHYTAKELRENMEWAQKNAESL